MRQEKDGSAPGNPPATAGHPSRAPSPVHQSTTLETLAIDDRLREIVRQSLEEDIGPGDVTTGPIIPPQQKGSARVVAKQEGVFCGAPVFREVFAQVDASVAVSTPLQEGEPVRGGQTVFTLDGPLASILTGERVALNFLSMLSGVATTTSHYAHAVRHTPARILDTRKTTPLHRKLEKYAVRVGGGVNHREALYDMVLIKENHHDACGGIANAVKAVRERWADRFRVEVETRNLDEVRQALDCRVDRIMLDNMDLPTIREAVALIGDQAEIEASGGVNLENIVAIAEAGVDFVSIGRLTHSNQWVDYSMLVRSE